MIARLLLMPLLLAFALLRDAPYKGPRCASRARTRATSGWRAARAGICQMITRFNSGTPGSGGSANDAWANAKRHGKVIESRNPAKWPIGSAIMMTGRKYGHAMTYTGSGKGTSTDYPRARDYSFVNPFLLERLWGYTVKGVILVDGNGFTIADPIKQASDKHRGMYHVVKTPTKGRCYGRYVPSKRGKVKVKLKRGRNIAVLRFVKGDGIWWAVTKEDTYVPVRNLAKGRA